MSYLFTLNLAAPFSRHSVRFFVNEKCLLMLKQVMQSNLFALNQYLLAPVVVLLLLCKSKQDGEHTYVYLQ